MRIDDGCWCSSLFMLLKSQDGGRLCVGESVKSLSFSQSDFLRKESLFAVPSSPLCIMTCFLWTLTACLHLLSLLGHLNARRPSCVPRAQLGPPCTTYALGDPSSHSPSAFTWVVPFCLDRPYLIFLPFMTSSTVCPLKNLHWPLPPIHKESGIFPSLCPPQLWADFRYEASVRSLCCVIT